MQVLDQSQKAYFGVSLSTKIVKKKKKLACLVAHKSTSIWELKYKDYHETRNIFIFLNNR